MQGSVTARYRASCCLTTALVMGSSSPDSTATQRGMGRPSLSFSWIVRVCPCAVNTSDRRNSPSAACVAGRQCAM